MAVICLTKHEQKYIRYFYSRKEYTITELSIKFSRSRRTIKRVIDEVVDE